MDSSHWISVGEFSGWLLQEAAKAARIRAESGPNAAFLLEQEAEAAQGTADGKAAAAPAAAAATAEAAYLADLRTEMEVLLTFFTSPIIAENSSVMVVCSWISAQVPPVFVNF